MLMLTPSILHQRHGEGNSDKNHHCRGFPDYAIVLTVMVEDLDHEAAWGRLGSGSIPMGHAWASFRLLGNQRSRASTTSDFQVVTKHAETGCGPPFQAGPPCYLQNKRTLTSEERKEREGGGRPRWGIR